MKTIELDEARIPEILEAIPPGQPIVMLNLLKFNRITNYPEGTANIDCSGQEAYSERYLKHAVKKIDGIGGSVIYDGEVCVEVIGENHDNWHRIIIVKYPSIAEFMGMVSTTEYQAIRIHRAAALDDSRLLATVENA
ncbi:MAG: DUF1330 domain-containing protein [Halioglobus sp.]